MDDSTVTDPAQQLRAALPVPIADLSPQLPDPATKAVSGIVTITWPYNSVSSQLSFTLAEPDFRLRLRNGQIRVNLHGPAAAALAQSGLGSSDNVTLSLQGAEWQPDNSTSRRKSIPNSTQQWQLSFTHCLILKLSLAETEETKVYAISEATPQLPSEPIPTAQSAPEPELQPASPISQPSDIIHKPSSPVEPPLITPAKNNRIRKLADEFESPAFVKRARVSYGSLFEDGWDIFQDSAPQRPANKRKSTGFARPSGAWRYNSHSPSPSPEPAGLHDDDADDDDLDMPSSPARRPESSANRASPDATAPSATTNPPSVDQQMQPPLQPAQAEETPHSPSRSGDGRHDSTVQPPPLSFTTQTEAFTAASSSLFSTQSQRDGSLNVTFDSNVSGAGSPKPWDVQGPSFEAGAHHPVVDHDSLDAFDGLQASSGESYVEAAHESFAENFVDVPTETPLTDPASAYPPLDFNGTIQAPFHGHASYAFSEHPQPSEQSSSAPSQYPAPDGNIFVPSGTVAAASSSWVPANHQAEAPSQPQGHRGGSAGHSSESPVVIDESDSDDEPAPRYSQDKTAAGHGSAEPRDLAEDEDEDAENEADAQYSEGDEPEDENVVGGDYDARNYAAPDDDEDDSHDEDLRPHSLEPEFADEEQSWDEEEELELEDEGEEDEDAEQDESDEDMESDGGETLPAASRPAASASSAVIDLISDSEDDAEGDPHPQIASSSNLKAEKYSSPEDASDGSDDASAMDEDDAEQDAGEVEEDAEETEEYSEESEEDAEAEEDAEVAEEDVEVAEEDVEVAEEQSTRGGDEEDEDMDEERTDFDGFPDENDNISQGSAAGNIHGNEEFETQIPDESDQVGYAEKVNSRSPQTDSAEQTDTSGEPSKADLSAPDVSVPAPETSDVLTESGSKAKPQGMTAESAADTHLPQEIPEQQETSHALGTSPARVNFEEEKDSDFDQQTPNRQPHALESATGSPELPFRLSPKDPSTTKDAESAAPEPSAASHDSEGSVRAIDTTPASSPLKTAAARPEVSSEAGQSQSPRQVREAGVRSENSRSLESATSDPDSSRDLAHSPPIGLVQAGPEDQVEEPSTTADAEETSPAASAFQTQLDFTQTNDYATQPSMLENLIDGMSASVPDFRSSLRSVLETDEELQNSILEDSQYDMMVSPTKSFSRATSHDDDLSASEASPVVFSPTFRQRLFDAIEAGSAKNGQDESQHHDPGLELARAAQASKQIIQEIQERARHKNWSLEMARAAEVSSQIAQEFEQREQHLEHSRAVEVSRQIAHEIEQRSQRMQQMDTSLLLARGSNKSKHARVGSDRRRSVGTVRSRTSRSSKATTPEMYDTSLLLARGWGNLPARAEEDGSSIAAAKLGLGRLLRDDLPDCTPLQSLQRHLNKTLDVIGVVMLQPAEPRRAKRGPREFMMSFTVTDHSSAPNSVSEVQLYRPHKESLPIVKVGDVVLLRHFKATALKDKGTGLRTTDESSWAVFDMPGEPAQVKGPPVEYGAKETAYVEALREWFGLLGGRALGKLERANRSILRAGAGSPEQSP